MEKRHKLEASELRFGDMVQITKPGFYFNLKGRVKSVCGPEDYPLCEVQLRDDTWDIEETIEMYAEDLKRIPKL